MKAISGYCWLDLIDARGHVELCTASKTMNRKELLVEAAHKINNFDKAVEALKREHKELLLTQPPAGQVGDRWMERRDAVAELIAELGEVK